MLSQRHKENLLSRISSGRLFYEYQGILYEIGQPSPQDLYYANRLYEQVYESTLFEGLYSRSELETILATQSLWTKTDEDKLTKLEEKLEEFKVEIYVSRLDPVKVKNLSISIKNTITQMAGLYERKHSLDHLGAEGYANMIRRQYLIKQTVKVDNSRLLNENSNFSLLEEVFLTIAEAQAGPEELRELARTEPWRSYWEISKPIPFSSHPSTWTEDQRTLVKFSKMYDSVFAHPECPPDDVIANDYMLDGWIILQNKEKEREQAKSSNEDVVNQNVAKHNEIFIMAKNPEHAKNIEKMNDGQGKLIKKERQAAIKSKGEVKESKLPDMQREIFNLKNQARKHG